MASNSSVENQLEWNSQLFVDTARNHFLNFAAKAAEHYQPVQYSPKKTGVSCPTPTSTSNDTKTEASLTAASTDATNDTAAKPTCRDLPAETTKHTENARTPATTGRKNPSCASTDSTSNSEAACTTTSESASSSTSSPPDTTKKSSDSTPESTKSNSKETSQSKKSSDSTGSSKAQGWSPGLKPPIETNIDWKTTAGPAFLILNPNYTTDVPQSYKDVIGGGTWDICGEDTDRCIKSISDKYEKHRVFLLCSGTLGCKIVPSIHSQPQIHLIFIHCGDVNTHRQWTKEYSKVRIVSNQLEKLEILPQLAFDCAYFNYQWGCALIEQNQKDRGKEKLEKGLELLKKQTQGQHDQKYETMIQEKIKQCA